MNPSAGAGASWTVRTRAAARRLGLGLATLAGHRRGYFIPYRYAGRLCPPGTRPPYRLIERRLAERAAEFGRLLGGLAVFAEAFAAIGTEPPPAPRWQQDWFPRLDAAMAYSLVRERRPARIVEIGSGHSTRFLARAVRDGQLSTRITAIDPAPRAALANLPIEFRRAALSNVDRAPFDELAAGDMLFVDSSHVLMPGTDVDLLFNDIVPALPAGLLLHVHDVFLPDDYPAAWAWRGYNEQLAVAPLLAGDSWRTVFASRYCVTRMPDAVAASIVHGLPLAAGAFESSLWLERAA